MSEPTDVQIVIVPPSSLHTLKRIVGALIAALLAMSVSIVILVAVVAQKTHNDRRAQAVTDCRALFGSSITDAAKDASEANGLVVVELARAVIAFPPHAAFDPKKVQTAIDARDHAANVYAAAIDARKGWEAAGANLPCPIKVPR